MRRTSFFLFFLLLAAPALAANSLSEFPVFIHPLNSGALMPNSVFNYTFNFTNQSDCTQILYSTSAIITTNDYGWGNANLNITPLNETPSYLCEIRNGTLRTIHRLNRNIFENRTSDADILGFGYNKTTQLTTFYDARYLGITSAAVNSLLFAGQNSTYYLNITSPVCYTNGTGCPADSDTTYTAGYGLILTGTKFNITSPICNTVTEKSVWTATGWSCEADAGAGGGMTSWTLSNGSTTESITDGERVNITGGRNVTIAQVGAQVIINSIDIDTNDTLRVNQLVTENTSLWSNASAQLLLIYARAGVGADTCPAGTVAQNVSASTNGILIECLTLPADTNSIDISQLSSPDLSVNITGNTTLKNLTVNSTWLAARVPAYETDSAHDTCAEISGCVTSALSSETDPLFRGNRSIFLNTTGFAAENITSGTVADARIASTITRDTEAETIAAAAVQNTTIARTGTCAVGFVVQNTTTGGVQCIAMTAAYDLNVTNGTANISVTDAQALIFTAGRNISQITLSGQTITIHAIDTDTAYNASYLTVESDPSAIKNGSTANLATLNVTTRLNIGAHNLTTSQVPEGTNLYYTDTRAAGAVQNTTIARAGTCPAGSVVQNTTTSGVQCITQTVDTDTNSIDVQRLTSPNGSIIIVGNSTDKNVTVNSTWLDSVAVLQSEYTNLDTDSTNDLTLAQVVANTGNLTRNATTWAACIGTNVSVWNGANFTCTVPSATPTAETDPLWSNNQSLYYLKSNPLSFYNSTTIPAYLSSETDPLFVGNRSIFLNTTGFAAENITSGTVADARIASTITRDTEAETIAAAAVQNTTILRNSSIPTCSGTDKLTSAGNGIFTCSTDQTGSGGDNSGWINTTTIISTWSNTTNVTIGRMSALQKLNINGSINITGSGIDGINGVCVIYGPWGCIQRQNSTCTWQVSPNGNSGGFVCN